MDGMGRRMRAECASQTLTFEGIVGHALEYEVVSARLERTQGRFD